MKIAGYQQTTLIEWPGRIASVVWTPGCNFTCPFCHNSSLVDPKKVKLLKLTSERDILADLEKRTKWVDGLVITGGEPTLQKGIENFCRKVKKLGLLVMIETNGSRPLVIKRLINGKLVDFWVIDIKTSKENYGKVTGQKDAFERLQESVKLVLKSGQKLELRTTVVPGIHDQGVLETMAGEINKLLGLKSNRVDWRWQNFQAKDTLDPGFAKIKPYSIAGLKNLTSTIRASKNPVLSEV